MQANFLLGPAGSGKTWRCLNEVRAALAAAPDGPPLLWLAPKQATFQLERLLLSDPGLPGYTRLQILSFERLAEFIVSEIAGGSPRLLGEEGRLMVLRALLTQKLGQLKLFHATARLPGFAQQLSALLRELQRHRCMPERLSHLTARVQSVPALPDKLHDLALLLRAYLDWLREHDVQDADSLLELAMAALQSQIKNQKSKIHLAGLWLDGFAEMTPQELDLLVALLPLCGQATLAFCLEGEPKNDASWLSHWAIVGQTFQQCHQRLTALPDCRVSVEVLPRDPVRGRFAHQPALQHLERFWANPEPMEGASLISGVTAACASASLPQPMPAPSEQGNQNNLDSQSSPPARGQGWVHDAPDALNHSHSHSVRVVSCANPEAEAVLASREILRFVRGGGRFRDVAVMVRQLEGYHDTIRRIFARYEIPHFLDRREPVAHHPLAELTRYAMRIAAFGWDHADWFGALKTGLAPIEEDALDRLENEALARGWQGAAWLERISLPGDPALEAWLETNRCQIVPPFQKLRDALSSWQRRPTGVQLSSILRELWRDLRVDRKLEQWCSASDPSSRPRASQAAVHETVWEQMQQWLQNVELAFPNEALPLADWLPIVEAGLSNLTVGIIPPALDQVVVGAIDRSRNPDLQCVLVLGVNEGVFPSPPVLSPLLSQVDRETLADHGALLGPDHRQQIGLERYYGYIACTRASQHLILTYAQRDGQDRSLNPSPFIDHLQHLFPGLPTEDFCGAVEWREAVHRSELVAPLLKLTADSPPSWKPVASLLEAVPALAAVMEKRDRLVARDAVSELSPGLAEKLYGAELQTSVSALEDFAACPFKFFAARGLRAEERMEFELDPREKGSFQHEVLQEFHRRIEAQCRRWRDLTRDEARLLVRQIGGELLPAFREGLFLASQARQFTGRMLIEGLEKLIATLIGWSQQYQFDPRAVEVSFGLKESRMPAWRIDLDDAHALFLRGRIDRVDLCRDGDTGDALAVVIDYKSSARELDPVLLNHGLELQLLAYLGALSEISGLPDELKVARLIPAGVFYVSLRSSGGSASNRDEERGEREQARHSGYQHRGRFDGDHLEKFDNRDLPKGDQFRYAKNKNGEFRQAGNEALSSAEFQELVARSKMFLQQHGRGIYAGHVEVEPYRWKNKTACDFCKFRPVCRFDPWTQPYRVLRPPPDADQPASVGEGPERKAGP